jgi:exopolysaccharide biosynthesis polyprenyl glycosylphosphotransferase
VKLEDAPRAAGRDAAGRARPLPSPMRLRNTTLVLPSILLCADLLVLECAFLSMYWLRFLSGWFPIPKGVPDLRVYLLGSVGVLAVFIAILYAHGMYDLRRRPSIVDDLGGLARSVLVAGLLLAAAAFFYRGYSFSRTFLLAFLAASWIFLLGGRLFARYLHLVARSMGIGVQRVALLGRGPQQDRLVRLLRTRAGLGFALVGEVLREGDAPSSLPVLGFVQDLPDVVAEHGIEVVMVTLPLHQLEQFWPLLDLLADHQVHVSLVPDLEEIRASKLHLHELGGVPFMELRQVALTGMDRVVKRSFDLGLSGLLLVLLAPLLGLIALGVRLSSPGPVLFRQQRVGRDGGVFDILKFRTMVQDAERTTGPVFASAADPRRTGLGRLLRAFSLDELPQLYNVLRGDMSLVGPRPERPMFVQEFRSSIPRYFERHKVRSGITGWAQVNGLRGDTPLPDRTRFDIYYVENWSLAFDVKILALTLRSVLSRRNAY